MHQMNSSCIVSAPWPERRGGQHVTVLVLVIIIVVVAGVWGYTLADVTALIAAAAAAVAIREGRR
jgi:hypothetical protein